MGAGPLSRSSKAAPTIEELTEKLGFLQDNQQQFNKYSRDVIEFKIVSLSRSLCQVENQRVSGLQGTILAPNYET